MAVNNVTIENLIPNGYQLTAGEITKQLKSIAPGQTIRLAVTYSAIVLPETGDNSNIALWMLLLLLSGAGFVIAFYLNKRSRKALLSLLLCITLISPMAFCPSAKAVEPETRSITVTQRVMVGGVNTEIVSIITYSELPHVVELYKVEFDLNYAGASGAPAVQYIAPGEKIIAPANPERTGYVFYGWSTFPKAIAWVYDPVDFGTYLVSENTVFYAIWESEDEDIDGDGLSYKEEAQYSTDSFLYDTDRDGLSDGDEVHKYTTNPLDADTDDDGVADGLEVSLGLNPLEQKTDGHTHDAEKVVDTSFKTYDNQFTLSLSATPISLRTFSVEALSLNNLVDSTGLVSQILSVEHDQSQSFSNAKLVFDYSDVDLAGIDPDSLTFLYLNEVTGKYEVVPSRVDKANKLVMADPTHFSRYVVGSLRMGGTPFSYTTPMTLEYDGESIQVREVAVTGFDVTKHAFAFHNWRKEPFGGLCYGMSVVPYLNYIGKLPLSGERFTNFPYYNVPPYDVSVDRRFYTGQLYDATESDLFKKKDDYWWRNDIDVSKCPMLDCIYHWHAKQHYVKDKLDNSLTLERSDTFKNLQKQLQKDEPAVLYMSGNGKHFVLICGLYQTLDSHSYYFSVYDPNDPGKIKYIKMMPITSGTSLCGEIPGCNYLKYYSYSIFNLATVTIPEGPYVPHEFTVTWLNEDGTLLEKDENVPYGTMPEYNGATPKKAADAAHSYTFVGWSPAVTEVTGDVTYTAQFTSATTTYTVTWLNEDGTVLEKDENVAYGTTPVYNGATPKKAADAAHSYTFVGWSPAVTEVTDDVTYTAQFASAMQTYVTADKAAVIVGDNVLWTANVTGGKEPLSYRWEVYWEAKVEYTGTSAVPTLTYAPMHSGTYTVKVIVSDAEGNIAEKTGGSVSVSPRESTPVEDFTFTILDDTYCSLTGYTGTDTEIVLPTEDAQGHIVKTIGQSAFSHNTNLKSVVISKTIESIESHTFYDCTGLTSIILPEGLTMIAGSMFYNCTSLESIHLPDSIETIGGKVFHNCTKLASIVVPEGISSIPDDAFNGCSSLTSVILPEGLMKIGRAAFSNCSSLESIHLPDSIETMDDSVFYNCTKLASIVMSEGVKRIGRSAFQNCTSLESIHLPDSIVWMGYGAFYGCTKLTSIVVPEGVTSIGMYMFSSCSSLTNVNLPEGLTEIGDYAFNECTSLKSIHLPDSIETMDENAFYRSALSNVNYPLSWKNVSDLVHYSSPFSYCADLSNIIVPEGVTAIPDYAFASVHYLTSVYIPESVTKIGYSSFKGCKYLTIYGVEGSYAETYANEHNIPFISTPMLEVTLTVEQSCVVGSSCSIQATAQATSGTAPYTYQFSLYGAGGDVLIRQTSYSSRQTYTFVIHETGNYRVGVSVKDDMGVTTKVTASAGLFFQSKGATLSGHVQTASGTALADATVYVVDASNKERFITQRRPWMVPGN